MFAQYKIEKGENTKGEKNDTVKTECYCVAPIEGEKIKFHEPNSDRRYEFNHHLCKPDATILLWMQINKEFISFIENQ